MARTVTVKLKHPFPGHGGQVNEVVMREPRGEDYLDLGLPYKFMTIAGQREPIDIEPVIKQYLERCIEKPDPLLAITQMSLVDAIAVKDALTDFFIVAPAAKSSGSTQETSTSA